MKKLIYYMIFLIAGGILAYFIAYYSYMEKLSKPEVLQSVVLQETVPFNDKNLLMKTDNYYLVKIEKDSLIVYTMPEEQIYDSIKLSSLYISENEYEELYNGLVFEHLNEVLEFLENSMS